MSLMESVKRLSFSSVSLFKNQPAAWCVRYLFNVKDEMGPAVWRGSAVEAGLDLAVMKPGTAFDDCQRVALTSYEQEAQGEMDDKAAAERENVTPILKQAIEAFKGYGMPTTRQFKVEGWLDGVPLPFIGYADYGYDDAVRDLKTTLRMPSEVKPDHAMQVAFYAKQMKRDKGEVVYVTPKKFAAYTITDLDTPLNDLARSARALCAALKTFSTPDEMASVYAPDFESFYWSPPLIERGKEIWR